MDSLSYFYIPANAPQRLWYVLSGLWDGAYKRTLAANLKELWQWVSSLAI